MNTLFKLIGSSLIVFATAALLSPGCAAQSAGLRVSQAKTTTNSPAVTASPGLMNPSLATEQAPPEFYALFKTTQGEFTVRVTRSWAPNGADRFYNMIRVGYFNSDIAIYRAIEGFMFQFGIHGDPAVNAKWSNSTIADDPPIGKSNVPGTLSFAQTQLPNSRSVQMFVNLGLNTPLDQPQGRTGSPFVPFAEVVRGLNVLQKINTSYGENPRGENIQGNFKAKGNEYILERFPGIDLIRSVTIIEN